jgi:hypothetical protein
MILEAHVTKAVVDGQYGEVSVTCVTDDALENLQITVSTKPTDPNAPATPALGFLPDNDGYVLPAVAKATTVTRAFAIKPVAAEAGKTYVGEVQVTWKGGTPVAKTFSVPVEARPEVYAALGAVEHLRRTFLGAYESLKQVGKTVHQGTTLPDSGGEPVAQALRPETFQWALSMVEMGTQIFRQNVPSGTSGGTSGTGTPKANG